MEISYEKIEIRIGCMFRAFYGKIELPPPLIGHEILHATPYEATGLNAWPMISV